MNSFRSLIPAPAPTLGRGLLSGLCLCSLLFLNACGGGGGGDEAGAGPVAGPDAAASLLSANPTNGLLADGLDQALVTVELVDQDGQPLAGAMVTLTASGTGVTLVQPTTATDASGRTSGSVRAAADGPKEVGAIVTTSDGPVTLGQTVTVVFDDPVVPALVGPARFEDADQSSDLSAGDRVILRFTTEVDASAAVIGDFDLPVTGDSFGTGASVQSGPGTDEVTIQLGNSPRLRSRGLFDTAMTEANSPSGVSLIPGNGIVRAGTSSTAGSGTVDLHPAPSENVSSPSVTDPRRVAVGDVDRDGTPDLWVTTGTGSELLVGDGALGFTQFASFGSMAAGDAVVVDMNRFGGEDIAVVEPNGVQLWLNSSAGGTLSVSADSMLTVPDVEQLLAADIDTDGYVDLVLGTPNGVQVWQKQRNIGLDFTFVAPLSSGVTDAVAVGDLDGDGDPDLVIASAGGAPRIFSNQGSFSISETATLPLSRSVQDMAVGDVTGDGRADVVAATTTGNGVLFVQTSTGFRSVDLGLELDRVEIVDQDGDVFLDLVATDGDSVRTYANRGDETFAASGFERMEGTALLDLAVADLDREGDPELVTLTSAGPAVHNGSGTGTFGTVDYVEADQLGAADSLAIVGGDIDGDGDIDFIAGNSGPDTVWVNDGNGSFTNTAAPGQNVGTTVTSGLALGDLDGDGDLDLVQVGPVSMGPAVRIAVNNGAGLFTEDLTFGNGQDALSVALGDIDRDGDVDIVVGNDGANEVWENVSDSNGLAFMFRSSLLPSNPNNNDDQTNALVLIDIDRDGDLDLITANGQLTSGEENRLYLNTGDGTLSFVRNLPGAAQPSFSIATADMDRDGRVDLVIGNRGNGSTVRNQVIRGFGNGQFDSQTIDFIDGLHDTRGIGVADIDRDGDLDVITADVGSDSFRIWENDGSANLSLRQRLGNHNSAGLIVADIDRDGDADAVVVNRLNQPNRVYQNR